MKNVHVKGYDYSKKKKCCLCGKMFNGYGNNPAPLKANGLCCDDCNMNKVIPARLSFLR